MRAYNFLTLILATLATLCWWRASVALGLVSANPATVRASFRLWAWSYTGIVWLGFGAGLWALADTLYLKRAKGTADGRLRAWLLVSPFLLWFLGVFAGVLLTDAWTRFRTLHGLGTGMGMDASFSDPALLILVAVPLAVGLGSANAWVLRWLRLRADQQARIENMNQRARR